MKLFNMLLLFFCFIFSCFSLASIREEFEKFKGKFQKKYVDHIEEQARFTIFQQNIKIIENHNLSGKSWRMGKFLKRLSVFLTCFSGITKFCDLTEEEFMSVYATGYKGRNVPSSSNQLSLNKSHTLYPDLVDWRTSGIITDVKDQGRCGSCWAFTATENIESYSGLATGNLRNLSVQQITSCAPNDLRCGGSGGCSGSIPQLGFNYIQLFSQYDEMDYP